MIANAISVDVEDWYQVGAFESVIDRKDWPRLESRVETNTDAVMALLDRAGVKGTFFTLGSLAARYPAMVRKIADAGHEVASHGWDHARVFQMAPEAFRKDVTETRKALEDACGARIEGYRAPSFSIDARTPWAHEILAETGHSYSSSIAPIVHDHYGWRDAPRFAYRPVAGNELIELPVTTAEAMGRRFAAGGGGFFRLLPYALSRWAVRQVNREGKGAIIYFHPWEIDPAQPRVAGAPLKSSLRHYTNLRAMEAKLERLLGDFSWGRVDALVAQLQASLA